MNWAWITGHLTEHEMKLDHGLELERIKASQKAELADFDEAASVGGGRVYPARQERLSPLQRLYGTVRDLNETIKKLEGKLTGGNAMPENLWERYGPYSRKKKKKERSIQRRRYSKRKLRLVQMENREQSAVLPFITPVSNTDLGLFALYILRLPPSKPHLKRRGYVGLFIVE